MSAVNSRFSLTGAFTSYTVVAAVESAVAAEGAAAEAVVLSVAAEVGASEAPTLSGSSPVPHAAAKSIPSTVIPATMHRARPARRF